MPRLAPLATLLVLALAGCEVHHYMVAREQALVHSTPGGEVIARMPRYSHAPLGEEPEGRWVPVALEDGRAGYLERQDVRLFSYLDPDLDDGDDRDATIDANLREVKLGHLGGKWDPQVKEAIRDERVQGGFSREQVEVAWGWPLEVVALAGGREQWLYRAQKTKRVRRWVDGYFGPYSPLHWNGGFAAVHYGHGWRGGYYVGSAIPRYRHLTVEIPITVENTVVFDKQGQVVDVRSRELLEAN